MAIQMIQGLHEICRPYVLLWELRFRYGRSTLFVQRISCIWLQSREAVQVTASLFFISLLINTMQYIHWAIEYLEIIWVEPTRKAINDFVEEQILIGKQLEELFK